MISMRYTTLLVVSLTALALRASSASAASGTVSGTLRFQQLQGGYCPTARNPCTGARYLQSEYGTQQPIKDVKIIIKNNVNGATIGQGSTSSSGAFSVNWSYPANVSSAAVYWRSENKNGRFYVTNLDDSVFQFSAWSSISLTNGTTSVNPQNLGSREWSGPTSTTQKIANLMNGAWRMWTDSLSNSSLMLNYFNNVHIYAFTTEPDDCPTSCASGDGNWIRMDEDSEFAPQARIMHEMGHIATYVANQRGATVWYNYPNSGTGGGWDFASTEWREPAFDEGFATFLGDRALYWATTPDPRTCYADGTSCGPSHDTELSLGSSCDYVTAKHDRNAVQVVRFLRDLYDTTEDSDEICSDDICVVRTDTVSTPFYSFFDVYASFPLGFGDRDINEPWAQGWVLAYVDDPDGRRGDDFRYRYAVEEGPDPGPSHALNCQP